MSVVPINAESGPAALTTQEALEALCNTRRLIDEAQSRLDAQVVDARRAGASWEDVAYATGYSCTHAHRRWNALCGMFGAGSRYRTNKPAVAS